MESTSECVCGCVCVWALIRAVATACRVLNVKPNPQTLSASIFKLSYQYFFGLASRNSRQNWGLKHSFFRKDAHGRYHTEGLAVRGWFVGWGHGLFKFTSLFSISSCQHTTIFWPYYRYMTMRVEYTTRHYSISCTYASSRYFDGYPLKRSLSRFQSFVPGKNESLEAGKKQQGCLPPSKSYK